MPLARLFHALALTGLCLSMAPALSQDPPAHPALQRADAAFLKQAAENGHAEVESSRLALGKLTSPTIRAFAQRMVDDHERAGSELKTLAASKGVAVSDRPSLMQRARIRLLSANDGDEFALRYVRSMGVDAHQETIELFERAAAESADADVKAFASRTLPTLQQHLAHARELQASIEGAPRRPEDSTGQAPAQPAPARP